MKISQTLNIFSCYKGIERSVLTVDALTDYNRRGKIQVPVRLFLGGMRLMQTYTVVQLQQEIPDEALVTLIHDRSDNDEVAVAWQTCQVLLAQAGREYQTVDTDQIFIYLRSLKINPDEYKY
jgi:hypothetical protein